MLYYHIIFRQSILFVDFAKENTKTKNRVSTVLKRFLFNKFCCQGFDLFNIFRFHGGMKCHNGLGKGDVLALFKGCKNVLGSKGSP